MVMHSTVLVALQLEKVGAILLLGLLVVVVITPPLPRDGGTAQTT